MIKVAHLTSVHSRYDTRIFVKQCTSLAASNRFDMALIVADGRGNEIKNGVNFYDVGKISSRINRIIRAPILVYKKAIEIDADIYHLHDPELMPIGIKLKKNGKKVIFDMHEDFTKQLLSKPYLNKYFAKVISMCVEVYEKYAIKRFDGVITATDFIREKFLAHNPNTQVVFNYPLLSEFPKEINWESKTKSVCYVGAISKTRGISEIVSAMNQVGEIKLKLGGKFSEANFYQQVKNLDGWNKVDELGFISRAEVQSVFQESIAGLVTLHPTINYLDSLPVKMFEYMAAGIAVICSNFPVFEEIVKNSECGLSVDPLSSDEIAKAINVLSTDFDIARKMGKNGRKLVEEKYNWSLEERKLISFYHSI